MKKGDLERSWLRPWAKVSKRIEVSHLREVQRKSINTATTLRQRETNLLKEKGW
jgi:flagellar basal body rod protein FlgF